MRKYQFDYTIYPDNSPQKFKSACLAIESTFPQFGKEKLLVDVDGSTIQVYTFKEEEIAIYDDYDVGAVYVLSDVDVSAVIRKLEG